MAKPTSRSQLLTEMEQERLALEDLVGSLSEADLLQPNVVGLWSVKDVVAHLVGWHRLCLGWHAAEERGTIPALPAEGFTWRQLPQLNQSIYEQYREMAWDAIQGLFQASYQELYRLVETLPDEDVSMSGRYRWTGTKALLDYVAPNTSEHYRWARREIQKGRRARRQSS